MKTETAKRVLELAKEAGALLYGDFTLTSGKKSTYYFDGKKLTFSPEGAYQVGKAVFEELAGLEIDAVGGVPVGGYPIVTAFTLVSYQEGKPTPAFIVRETHKEHGTQSQIEGHFKEGFRVAIVDDVITTGGSVKRVIAAVEAAGGKVVKIIVIVDRHEGGSDRLKSEGYNFSAIIDLWQSGEATVGGG
ncbi:MAG: orotate phosphoribosyltransferase [Dehalococcoidales bacterium]|nr:orotate phosphoribosyltransferase [Dehalococcoidales bacterium]MDZ4230860.1 orotate phosphoribosyltransferase [Dehalococcoidales bacterium]